MTTDNALTDAPSSDHLEAGCSKCRPQVVRGRGVPGWFYNSREAGRLPQLGLGEADLQRKAAQLVPEDERISRVQEWLRRTQKGGAAVNNDASDAKRRVYKNQYGGKVEEGNKRSVRNMADARDWYINKATRTSVTSLFSAGGEKGAQRKQIPGKSNRLDPLDQLSAVSGSLKSGSGNPNTHAHRTSVLPEDDIIQQHLERKKKLEQYRLDRSFTKMQLLTDAKTLSREKVGPIARPHTPVRSLGARQRALVGADAWFGRGEVRHDVTRVNPRGSDVYQMQSRTYELQSQLQQMLDRQKSQ